MHEHAHNRLGFVCLATGEVPDTLTNVNDLVEQFHHQPATTIKDRIKRFVKRYLEFYCQ